MFSSSIGLVKPGHPDLLSYLSQDANSGSPETTPSRQKEKKERLAG
jgi:hypothetical protein